MTLHFKRKSITTKLVAAFSLNRKKNSVCKNKEKSIAIELHICNKTHVCAAHYRHDKYSTQSTLNKLLFSEQQQKHTQ